MLASSSSESSSLEKDFLLPEVLQSQPKSAEFMKHTVSLFIDDEFFVHFWIPKNIAENLAESYAKSVHFPKYNITVPVRPTEI